MNIRGKPSGELPVVAQHFIGQGQRPGIPAGCSQAVELERSRIIEYRENFAFSLAETRMVGQERGGTTSY
jgi:hypothetical protein